MTQDIQSLLNEQHTRILNAQNNLTATDYIAAKIAEGAATKEEYEDEIAQRQQWRDEINAAQSEITRLEAIEPEEPETPEINNAPIEG